MYYRTNILRLTAVIAIVFGFSACKKYPENNLWLKKPEKAFYGGKITSYTANGIDLMPYYKTLYSTFPYNNYGQSIDNVFHVFYVWNPSNNDFVSDIGIGSLKFSKTKKEVEINFKPVNSGNNTENIFLNNLSWKIIKLTKSGQLKIQADYNFKKYELQFN